MKQIFLDVDKDEAWKLDQENLKKYFKLLGS